MTPDRVLRPWTPFTVVVDPSAVIADPANIIAAPSAVAGDPTNIVAGPVPMIGEAISIIGHRAKAAGDPRAGPAVAC